MERGADDDELKPLRIMPWWLVTVGLAVALLAGWLVLTWLLGEADQGTTRAQLRIDAIRIGLTVVAGVGGGVALLLAARRQWLNERAQRHAERVAADARAHESRAQDHEEATAAATQRHQQRLAELSEHDATERRITDLYTRAVDQLGSQRAAVRLGGLYALERLAQDHPTQRQAVVDIICAYLRMPMTSADGVGRAEVDHHERQEGQVRQSAQRLLTGHLRVGAEDLFWPGVCLDLSGARLTDFDASGCRFGEADFSAAVFEGRTCFEAAVFEEELKLSGSRFVGVACLGKVVCRDKARFSGVTFESSVEFDGAVFGFVSFDDGIFRGAVSFREVTVAEGMFERCHFADSVSFGGAVFARNTSFEHATFDGEVAFRNVRCGGIVLFRFVVFAGPISFAGATFEARASFGRAQFRAGVDFASVRLGERATFEDARVSGHALREWPPGYVENRLDDSTMLVERKKIGDG